MKFLNKTIINAYKYNTICFICGKEVPVYFTLLDNDYGDEPILRKCKICDTLYLYRFEDAAYIQPIEKQVDGKTCLKCNKDLKETLVPTHTYLKCCGTIFSLDDDFDLSQNLDSSIIEKIEAYLIYR